MADHIIADTPDCLIEVRSDELLITSKRQPSDAVKIRIRSSNPGAIGTYSWDFVFSDGSGAEVGYIKMEIDDRYRDPAGPNYPTSMFEFLIRKFVPGGSDDAEYVKVLRLRWDLIEALVPIRGGFEE